MTRSPPVWAAAVVLALIAMWLGAGRARAVVVRLPNGRAMGIAPPSGVSLPGVRPTALSSPDNGTLDYQGGPVVRSSAPYVIFWDPSSAISASTQALLTRYFSDVAHDSGQGTNDYGVLRQYSDRTGIADYAQTFSAASQVIADAHAYPPPDGTNCPLISLMKCVSDGQVQGELSSLITNDHLPTDGSSATDFGAGAPVYFIVVPPSVNVCLASSNCAASNGFCSYHRYYIDNNGHYVLYVTIPLIIYQNSPKQCQNDGSSTRVQEPNQDVGDVALKSLTHEYSEVLTDPLLNAWYDFNSGQEVADNCNAYAPTADPANGNNPFAFAPTLGGSAAGGTLYDQLINSNRYYLQSVWSNGDVNCELRPSAGAIAASFTISSGNHPVGSPVSFDPRASSSTAGYSSAAWSFGDGTTSFSSTATTPGFAPATVSHAYTAPGRYTVTLTLVDTRGNVASTTRAVTINGPTAAFSFSPATPVPGQAVAFTGAGSSDPNIGGAISSYSWSFGDGATATGGTASHAYAAPGLYTVQLTVTDNLGLSSAPTSEQIEVLGPPSAVFSFSPATPVSGGAVKFNGGGSTDPNRGGSISSDRWSFGDRGTATGSRPSHIFRHAGKFTVTLTVTDSFGVSTTVSRVLTVAREPKISHRSLTGIGKGNPKLTFELTAAPGAPRLAKIVIGPLPRGLSFRKRGLAKGLGVRTVGGQFTDNLSRGMLTIDMKSAVRAVKLTITDRAMTVSRKLEGNVRSAKIKTLRVPVIAIDTAGTQIPLTLVLRV